MVPAGQHMPLSCPAAPLGAAPTHNAVKSATLSIEIPNRRLADGNCLIHCRDGIAVGWVPVRSSTTAPRAI